MRPAGMNSHPCPTQTTGLGRRIITIATVILVCRYRAVKALSLRAGASSLVRRRIHTSDYLLRDAPRESGVEAFGDESPC